MFRKYKRGDGMSKKSLVIAGGVSGLILILALVLVFVEPVRNGVISTIKGTTSDTVDAVVNNQDPVPSPTEVEGLDGISEEPTEPTEELGKDTGVAKDLEEKKNAEEHFREDDQLKIYVLDTVGSTVLFTNGKDAMLVDGGFSKDLKKIHAQLDALGIKRLKYAVVSNWHQASHQGVIKTLEKYPADYIILSGNILTNENGKALTTYLTKKKLIWTIPSNTGSMGLGSSSVKFLSSNKGGSLLTFVNHGQTNIAVSGTTQYFEDVIFKYLPTNINLHIASLSVAEYTAPHELIEKINPEKIILNSLENFDDSKTIEKLTRPDSELLRTTDTGNIAIGSNGEDLNFILNTK